MGHDHGTSCAYDHHHHHHLVGDRWALIIALILNVIVIPLEIWGGHHSRSLSLFFDGGHMVSHLIIIILYLFALNKERYENIANFVNGVFLFRLAMCAYTFAIWRLHSQPEILSGTMFWVAITGLSVDVFQVLLFCKRGHHSNSMKGAFLHIFCDATLSLSIVLGSVLIYFDFYLKEFVDAILLFIATGIILKGGITVFRDLVEAK